MNSPSKDTTTCMDKSLLLRSIRENDDSVKDLHIGKDVFGRELMDALAYHNTTYTADQSAIRSLRMEEPVAGFGSDEVCQSILRMTSRLPALEDLELIRSERRHRLFHQFIEDLLGDKLADAVPRLKRLAIRIPGQVRDVGQVAAVFDRADRLEELVMSRLEIPRSDPLSGLISKLTDRVRDSLRVLDLTVRNFVHAPLVSEEAVTSVCRSGNLQSVSLVNVGLTDDHLVTMAQELGRNAAMEKVNVCRNWRTTKDGFLAVLRMMERHLYIKEFQLDESILEDPCSPFGALDRLAYLDASGGTDLDDRRTLAAKIESFARLNRAGRRQLRRNENAERYEWVDLLCVVRNDTDALYHVLLTKPEVCRSRSGGGSSSDADALEDGDYQREAGHSNKRRAY